MFFLEMIIVDVPECEDDTGILDDSGYEVDYHEEIDRPDWLYCHIEEVHKVRDIEHIRKYC